MCALIIILHHLVIYFLVVDVNHLVINNLGIQDFVAKQIFSVFVRSGSEGKGIKEYNRKTSKPPKSIPENILNRQISP